VDFEHDFGDGLKFKNQLKVNHNKTIQNTGTVQFVVSLLDPTLSSFLHTDRVGTYNLTDKRGALLAQIVRTAAGTAASGASVTVNNLPNQSVLNPGVIGLAAFDTTYDAREVMDQFALSKSWDRLSLRVGGFFAQSKFNTLQGAAGAAVEPIVPQPETIGITLTTPAGIVQQVTTPEGFASIGQRAGGTQIYDKQTQISAFGGANWELVQGLSLDAGVRYEHIQMSGVNTPEVGNPLSSDPTYGGLDGNPNTLYDNYVVSLGTPVRFRYNLDFMSYSGALTYRLGSGASVFVRFSQGQKAPDGITYATLDNPQKVALLNPTPQRIQQAEVGFKLSRRNLNVSVNPFYSRLSKVSTIQNFTNPDGSLYTNPPLYSELKTIGVEIEGDVSAFEIFNLRTAITIQDPKSKDFRIYVANGAGPADDTITQVPDGEAENNPKVQATTTLQVTPNEHITSFLTWKYLGKRAANRYNAFYLPSFSQYDIGATYTFDDHFSVSLTVNNLFDREGVVSYVLAGGFVSALDRQSLTPAQVSANPNQLFAILPIQPRSMFLSGSFKF
jgi:outer membrane receptor protein involved in Fe transport